MSFHPFDQFIIGFTAPIKSIKFFRKNISLLFLGLIPHLIIFGLYVWLVNSIILGSWLNSFVKALEANQSSPLLVSALSSNAAQIFLWIVSLLLYGLLGIGITNTLASPFYDIIASKVFTLSSKKSIPSQSFLDILSSIISELTKALIILGIFFFSLFVSIFAPLLLVASIWYLGWNTADRTLLMLNLSFKDRVLFGFKHFPMCLGLGIWNYIPLFTVVFSFVLAAAGAHTVAQTEIINSLDDSPGVDF